MKPITPKAIRLAKPLLGVVLLMLLYLASLVSSCTNQERSSLLQFVSELSQDDGLRSSWENVMDCCEWEGITCGPDRTVSDVSLASRSLQGPISASLGNLTGLLLLNLSYNLFFGGVPLELVSSKSIVVLDVSFNQLSGRLQELQSSTLQPLQVLNISSNSFTGQFPSTTWEAMKSLVALNASHNSFTGQIPTTFCFSAPFFSVLELSYNQFNGSIPPELGNCSKLTSLNAGHNNLSGTLPNELFDLRLLEHLSFTSNELDGSLGDMSNHTNLVTIDLGVNSLRGNIPDSIGELKRLEELHLDHNDMSGELPSSLSNCTHLVAIDFSYNYFSGELIKVNFSTLINLKTLDLLFNSFTGMIPESIYSCSNLKELRLTDNKLHGQLSPRIVNLKSLVFLSSSFNNFTNITNALHILKDCKELAVLIIGNNFKGEAMPEDETIDGFHNLQFLSLGRCSLSGTIPLWLSKLKNLEVLLLRNNRLTGPIPAWINSLKLLFHLDISENNLTGEIPTNLMEMPMLTTENSTAIDLDQTIFSLPFYRGTSFEFEYRVTTAFPKMLNFGRNNFTGVIPKEIGQLKSLAILNFSYNRLSGEIPLQLHSLTNLQVLDLSSNHLTGAIPMELNDLHFLSTINVSNNDLEGPIPTGGQFATFTNSSFGGNPKLCGVIVGRPCGSAGAPPVSTLSMEQTHRRIAFAIAFGAFFGVGVLYDQIVLSKYFG